MDSASTPESADSGGAKKFLYTAPKKGEDEEELPWNFKPQKQATASPTAKFDVDSAWSIQRNVNVGPQIKSPKSEQLNYNTSKGYYSRYGGNKDKDEFGGAVNTDKGGGGHADTNGGKSWGVGSQSRRPFSYSFGTEAQSTQDKPISPRHVSNSSASVYPQTQASLPKAPLQNGSLTSRPVNNSGSTMNSGSTLGSGSTMHSGNNNLGITSSKGSSSNSTNNSSSNSHGSQARPSFLDSSPSTNGHSHSNFFEQSSTSSTASNSQSRPSFLEPSPSNTNNNKNSSLSTGRIMNSQVASVGSSQSYGGPSRNSLFNASQPKGRRELNNDLFGINENWSASSKAGTSGRQNKSFW